MFVLNCLLVSPANTLCSRYAGKIKWVLLALQVAAQGFTYPTVPNTCSGESILDPDYSFGELALLFFE